MSLFDVIKYGNTDLSSGKSLRKLPSDLISTYWRAVNSYLPPDGSEVEAEILATWWRMKIYTHATMQAAFNKVLKEYDGPV